MRLISFTCALFFLAAPIFAGDKEDIQATISRQLEAFQLDDFAEAFSYASPSIQSIFGGPANFESMVKRGYPMVWKPGKVTFLSVDPYHHGMAQNIQIFDRNKKSALSALLHGQAGRKLENFRGGNLTKLRFQRVTGSPARVARGPS